VPLGNETLVLTPQPFSFCRPISDAIRISHGTYRLEEFDLRLLISTLLHHLQRSMDQENTISSEGIAHPIAALRRAATRLATLPDW
jgi:hypothetical protein